MRNDLTHSTLQLVSAAAVVIGLAIAGLQIGMLTLHGQPMSVALIAALRATWAYVALLACLLGIGLGILAAAAMTAGIVDAMSRRRRVGR